MSLFIGGPADGEHRAVNRDLPVVAIIEAPKLMPRYHSSGEETLSLKHHHYVRMGLGNDNVVYVHDSIHPNLIVNWLVRGYRQPL